MSREMAIKAEPLLHMEDVERLPGGDGTSGVNAVNGRRIGLAGTRDPRTVLKGCRYRRNADRRGNCIDPILTRPIWTARNTVVSMKGKAPLLEEIASDIPNMRDLSEEIFKSISGKGEVLSSATPKLSRLRTNVSKTFQRVMRAMERIANNKSVRQSLQSTAIATRGERLVLEVRADARESVPGIVHDVSGRGSTLFVEPLKAVDLCNAWRETAAEAQREEERILRRASRLIGVEKKKH
ncbi:MAG: hypothetical protein Ct9H300mP19_12420 [Dehalococcoidia bacterium]|nr:MAG: hypothetical protein Ct9H300mP19_12420 [Dehalococcoidia bacterium]